MDALQHLHAGYAHTHDIPSSPHEDPCTVWLRGAKTIQEGSKTRDLIQNLHKFAKNLDEIFEQAQELHKLVARPSLRTGTASGDVANRSEKAVVNEKQDPQNRQDRHEKQPSQELPKSHEDERQQQASAKPSLPNSLFRAFENIIVLFAIQACVVLLMTGNAETSHHRVKPEKLLQNTTKEYVSTFRKTRQLLETAQQDVIIGMTAESSTAVKMGAVGLEYLVATAMANVQRGAFCIGGPLSEDVGQGFESLIGGSRRRSAVIWNRVADDLPDQAQAARKPSTTKTSMASLDLLAIYTSYLTTLEVDSYRYPQRKAFLTIRALNEELLALKGVIATQHVCLEDFTRVIDPYSFPVTDGVRAARFLFEEDVLRRGKEQRQRQKKQLSLILQRASNLQVGIKESIEILDEGHSDAIRVFTFVTLLFLPL